MKKYEIMYIVNASLDDAAFKTVSDRLHATITENGGSIDKVDDWGVKEFAYEIDHMKKGHYVVINVTANNAVDEDGAITSYIWYYYTAEDPEPQDFRITKSPKTVFVLPRI